ncbi:FixH family protein [Leeuwenhoekiella parthenopeia]|uniref:FixH family protein n=1 Tax=Leeuwenhoekiella parthenopeia TaxID=2890320 RepID=A0ABS8GPZ7_9FLAO|nr:FixH family protein [Leeuwenhoekiella parthenopeia]MCC4212067.1 FixH family protein [Leeuwenhoekiella parthenopeia]
MKFNWGTGLVIGMLSFMSFILYFVITMSTDQKYSYDLVIEDYYKHEMNLQGAIDATENSNQLETPVTGTKTEAGYLIAFPENLDPKAITGSVFLYRPSARQLDFDMPIRLSSSNLLIPDKRLVGGRWNITITWEYEGKNYRFEDEITY